MTTRLRDQITTRLRDHMTMRLRDQMTTRLRDQITTRLRDHMTTRPPDQVTTRLRDQITTRLRDQITMRLRDQMTTRLRDHMTMRLRDQMTMRLRDQMTTRLRDQITTRLFIYLLLLIVLTLPACQPSPGEGNLSTHGLAETPSPTVNPTPVPVLLSPSPTVSPTPSIPDSFEQTVSNGALTLTARLGDGLFTLLLTFPGRPSDYNAFQVLLDVDHSVRSGYHTSIIGADFLLENANLFAYTGNGSDWRWLDVTPLELEYRQKGNQTVWQIPLSIWHFTCHAVTNKDCVKVFAFGQLADKGWNIASRTPAMTLLFPFP